MHFGVTTAGTFFLQGQATGQLGVGEFAGVGGSIGGDIADAVRKWNRGGRRLSSASERWVCRVDRGVRNLRARIGFITVVA
jgi:hypothetical protein